MGGKRAFILEACGDIDAVAEMAALPPEAVGDHAVDADLDRARDEE